MAIDSTVKIFDQFYNLNLVVNASEYEVVNSFFENKFEDKKIAKGFTEVLFRISNITQISVLELLSTFETENQNANTLEVNRLMAYYLNSVSNKTVLFGVNNLVSPNNSVQRNVIQ